MRFVSCTLFLLLSDLVDYGSWGTVVFMWILDIERLYCCEILWIWDLRTFFCLGILGILGNNLWVHHGILEIKDLGYPGS